MRITYAELREEVAATASWLRQLGVRRGDLVVGYLPNVPEAITGFLATVSIGAIWSACSPELGATAMAERYADLAPRVLIAVDGFRRGGREFDRRETVARLREWIPSLLMTVTVPGGGPSVGGWAAGGAPKFEQLDFDHPLYLDLDGAAGTTPWPPTRRHGPILREHWRQLHLEMRVRRGDRLLWATDTSQGSWHLLVSGLLSEAAIVLYDGDPAYPYLGTLWDLCVETRATTLVVEDSFVSACADAGLDPGEERDLGNLAAVGLCGQASGWASSDWISDQLGLPSWTCPAGPLADTADQSVSPPSTGATMPVIAEASGSSSQTRALAATV